MRLIDADALISSAVQTQTFSQKKKSEMRLLLTLCRW